MGNVVSFLCVAVVVKMCAKVDKYVFKLIYSDLFTFSLVLGLLHSSIIRISKQ